MSDTGPLLVPIQLDAMVVVPMPTEPFRRPTMAYNAIRLFGTPEPQPFAGSIEDFTSTPEHQGVYLMWTLPAALRHATQADTGSGAVEFPLVPNRWLVVRLHTPKSSGQASTTAWIVESDYLGDEQGSEFLDPRLRTPQPTTIGRSRRLSEDSPWSETSPTATILRAVGPGNPSFAAFQPHNENVFSIHDTLAQQPAVAPGTLDYFVAGWYADPTADPLHGWDTTDTGAYAKVLNGLQWAVPDPEHRTATGSLFHGMKLGVEWDPEGAPPSSARDDVQPSLALGNTATEALVALLKARGFGESDAELLEAFTLDLLAVLQQPGGATILDRELHRSWFSSATGGVHWQIVDRPSEPSDPRPDPSTADESWLSDLNQDQAQLDGKRRQLASLQQELYELWWKREYRQRRKNSEHLADGDFTAALDRKSPHSLVSRVKDLIDEIDTAQQALPSATSTDDIDEFAKGKKLPDTRQLVAGLAPRFYQPTDPVLVVGGLGHDYIIDPAATLTCRYQNEVVTAIAGVPADPDHLPKIAASGLPPAIGAVLGEFTILQAFHTLDMPGYTARLAAAENTPDAIEGKLPALAVDAWSQPWLPLYLEWQADWHPLPYQNDTTAQWSLDGDDLVFVGTAPTAPAVDKPWGRALLTPGLAFQVRSRLEQYVADHPSDTSVKALEDDLDRISGNWDFLSQTLDGLTTQLAWRDPWAARAPDVDIQPLVGDGAVTPPAPRSTSQGIGFTGLRTGRLTLTRVAVVDRFGQTLELLGPNAEVQTVPEIGAGLTPRGQGDSQLAELPPRLLQSARLRIDTPEGIGMIRGFLVPNHLDRALAVYDAVGQRLGELRLADVSGSVKTVVWDSAPTSPPGSLDGLSLDLAGILRSIAAAGPGALQNFLTTIDETLWTIDPLAGDRDEYLTALAGRPLALIAAELALELGGEPLRDPSWEHTFEHNPPPLLGYPFCVRLGAPTDREDGLIGYFHADMLDRFRAPRVPAPSDLAADPSGFVTATAPDDVLLRPDGATVASLLLLVDARATVQAHTGVLPATQLDVRGPALWSALAAIQTTFRAGPLLSERPQPEATASGITDAAHAPLLPIPTATSRAWRWLEMGGQAGPVPFPSVDDRARFSTLAPTAREGYVRVEPTEGGSAP